MHHEGYIDGQKLPKRRLLPPFSSGIYLQMKAMRSENKFFFHDINCQGQAIHENEVFLSNCREGGEANIPVKSTAAAAHELLSDLEYGFQRRS